jgi:hypothetical protein
MSQNVSKMFQNVAGRLLGCHLQGVLWGPPLKTTIPNPDSKISAIRLANGNLALAFNDHYRPFTGSFHWL